MRTRHMSTGVCDNLSAVVMWNLAGGPDDVLCADILL